MENPDDSAIPPRSTSYALPAADIPEKVRSSLDPWIAGFIGLTPTEATARLHQRWSTIQRPSLLALRETLSKFEVRAIVDNGAGGVIYAARDGSENRVGNSFYLPAALAPQEIEAQLQHIGLAENIALTEFLVHFAGLSEFARDSASFVYRNPPWPTFTDSWEGSIQGFDEWKSSLLLYHALDGSHVLVHPKGKVAWWVMAEHRVEEKSPNFDEFILYFNEHRKLAWPFDPYGPPEKRR